MKVHGERIDGEVIRVDALEARGRQAEESVNQEKEDRIAANNKEKESLDAANEAIAVLEKRIDELEAKKHELQSSEQKSDADAAEKIAACKVIMRSLKKCQRRANLRWKRNWPQRLRNRKTLQLPS